MYLKRTVGLPVTPFHFGTNWAITVCGTSSRIRAQSVMYRDGFMMWISHYLRRYNNRLLYNFALNDNVLLAMCVQCKLVRCRYLLLEVVRIMMRTGMLLCRTLFEWNVNALCGASTVQLQYDACELKRGRVNTSFHCKVEGNREIVSWRADAEIQWGLEESLLGCRKYNERFHQNMISTVNAGLVGQRDRFRHYIGCNEREEQSHLPGITSFITDYRGASHDN